MKEFAHYGERLAGLVAGPVGDFFQQLYRVSPGDLGSAHFPPTRTWARKPFVVPLTISSVPPESKPQKFALDDEGGGAPALQLRNVADDVVIRHNLKQLALLRLDLGDLLALKLLGIGAAH